MTASEFFTLAHEFKQSSRNLARALYTVYKGAGEDFAKDWAANASETSGAHGKWYPDSITSETRVALGVEVETGPDSSRKQGVMGRGFEFGSQNQPAHLDGARAMPAAESRLARGADIAVALVLP